MPKLVYMTNTSLDGYIEDETGAFDWGNPDPVFAFTTELLLPIGTHLYGRRLYETMTYWDAPVEGYPPEHRDFARVAEVREDRLFTNADRRYDTQHARRAGLQPRGYSEAQAGFGARLVIGGAELAGLAIEADLVDECRLFVNPVIVGGGKPAFRTGLRRNLELIETRRFDAGVIHLRYRIR